MRSLFDTIAPRYDLVNRIMSFGLDVRWRKASMKKLSAPGGSVVIDLACGTGDFCREIEKAGMVPVGLDLSMGMLAAARTGHHWCTPTSSQCPSPTDRSTAPRAASRSAI